MITPSSWMVAYRVASARTIDKYTKTKRGLLHLKVSIITTSYNRENSIGRAIRSVMTQSYPDIEHIVVDGASKDKTVEVIKSCNSPRIVTMISEPDHGVYEALNKGIRLATGDIVGWLHSDDCFYDDDVLKDVAEVFETTGCDMVYGNGLFVDSNMPDKVVRRWISGRYSDGKLMRGWHPLHTTVFVKRDIFDRFGLYNETMRMASDTEWLIKIMYKTGIHIEYMSQRYIVRMNHGGLSTSKSHKMLGWREDLSIYSKYVKFPYLPLACKILRKIPQYLFK